MYDEEIKVETSSSVQTRTLFVALPSIVSHYTRTPKPHKAYAGVLMVIYWGLLGHQFGVGVIFPSHSFRSSELRESQSLHALWCSFLIQITSNDAWPHSCRYNTGRICRECQTLSFCQKKKLNMNLAPNLCCLEFMLV